MHALSDAPQSGPVQVIRLDAPLRHSRAVDETAEDLVRHAHHALVFADCDAELDRLPVRIPAGVLGKRENMAASAGSSR
jgi:hypothetical protein